MKTLRKTIRNAAGEKLRGDLHAAPGSRHLVIVCHGFGKTWNKNRPLYRTICTAFQAAGVNAFRFSFSGLSPSEGKAEDSSYSKQKADLAAVIDSFTKKLRPDTIAVIAHSFGSVAAVLQATEDARIRQLLLVAPRLEPRKSMTTAAIEAYCGKKLDRIISSGTTEFPVCPIMLGGIEYKFSKAYLEDLLHTDVLAALERVQVPVTILRGTNDKRISDEEMRAAAARNSRITYVTLPDAGHSFGTDEQRNALCRELLRAFNACPSCQ
jgi:pimeloyl-ACP methyl ester carboxylesterase